VLSPELAPALTEFFAAFASGPEAAFFHPHPLTADDANRICGAQGLDLYYAAMVGRTVVAYGLLRGWDQGYDVPSLGIAIHPASRGRGLARPFMAFLHAAAKHRGARQIRLTVYNENQRAVELYRRLGYVFSPKNDHELVGILAL
jgi:ribosomal protein S18 acetylase RimI-like enzyme